jgi:hypothetical protein
VKRAAPTLLLLQAIALGACGQNDSEVDLPASHASLAAAGARASDVSSGAGPEAPVSLQTPVVACGTVACGRSAILRADVSAGIEIAQHWTFEACRNAECYVTREDADFSVREGAEGKHIYLADNVPQGGGRPISFELTSASDNAAYIEVIWETTSPMQDGDQYVLDVLESSGASQVLIDERVTYSHVPLPMACQVCARAEVDRRKTADPDAGT